MRDSLLAQTHVVYIVPTWNLCRDIQRQTNLC